MLPKMSEEKTVTPMTFITTQNEMSHPSKSRSYRKYVIIAVTGIVMAAIILTAILVGMHFLTEAQKEIVKFSYYRDQTTTEDVISDPNTNIVQYQVNNPNYKMWVIDDFNRDIQAMKIQTDSATDCYLAPLNRTTATDPTKISAPSNPNSMKQNVSYTVIYQPANTPISDSSFLSKAAKDMCNGISTYWVHPRCNSPEYPSNSPPKQKRRVQEDGCRCCSCCGCCVC